MFVADEDSNLCWFNPASLESSDEYYLVGCAVALAIYNSVTLDVPLPLVRPYLLSRSTCSLKRAFAGRVQKAQKIGRAHV